MSQRDRIRCRTADPLETSICCKNLSEGFKVCNMAKKPKRANARTAKKSIRQPKKAVRISARRSNKKVPSKPKKVTGTVLKIVGGRPTTQRLSAEEAFSDPQQAVEQVLYAERHGSGEEKRLVRLAYRQYQSKQFKLK